MTLDLSHAVWRKSSRSASGGQCVEVAMVDLSGAAWRKSTRSQSGGQCVEVAEVGGWVAVRDSKNTSGPALVFPPHAWHTFLTAIPTHP